MTLPSLSKPAFFILLGIILNGENCFAAETELPGEPGRLAITSEEHITKINNRLEQMETRMLALEDQMGSAQKTGNPVRASAQSIQEGQALYQQYCSKCHGDSGTGNGPLSRAIPNISDLTSQEIKNASDETIFHQITNGKPPMPSFQSLSEKQRWDIVNYVRSLQSGNEESNY